MDNSSHSNVECINAINLTDRRMKLPDGYVYEENGFIKQTDVVPFDYDMDYKMRQSTNIEMSYLRLGWLAALIPCGELKTWNIVDIGSGNGSFVECCEGKFRSVCGYDLSGPSISREELMTRKWDLIVLSDVLEHFHDIDELFDMSWHHAMISFPETPAFRSFEEMEEWRHFKPNEHIYYLNTEGIVRWLRKKNSDIQILSCSNFEDFIRTRWDRNLPNISTVLVKQEQ